MKSSVHQIVEDAMQALGPVFHKHKDWEDIRLATCLIMARVIQATPHKGLEQSILEQSQEDIAHALAQILKLEEQAVNARAAERDRLRTKLEDGIAAFGNLAPVNGSEPGPALVGEPVIIEEDQAPDEFDPEPKATMEPEAETREEDEDGYNPDGPRAYAP